jgi:type III pantothenate kinase
MLLAVDIGNTAIKFGVFDGEHLTFKLSVPTLHNLTPTGLANVLRDRIMLGITDAIVSSVVPEVEAAVREFIESEYNVKPTFVENTWEFGFKINHDPLPEAGTDRIVNTFSAVEKYGVPVIVCSFGTALAIDVVDPNRTLVGGLIAPGMNTLATALNTTTSKLPEVVIEKPSRIIQRTTSLSIQSGIVYGYFGLVETLLTQIKKEIGDDPKVVATGGFAKLIAENTTQIDIIDDNLLLDGLQKLHLRHQPL